MGVTVSEKSVFPTSFGYANFQGNLFSFEKHKQSQKIYLTSYVWRYITNDINFFLTAVDEN